MTETILDFLWKISWQAAILAAVVWIVGRLARKAPASWRYALWVMVLIKFVIPPFAYLPEQMALWNGPRAVETAPASAPMQQPTAAITPTSVQTPPVSAPAGNPPAVGQMVEPTPYEPTPFDIAGTLFSAWLLGTAVMASVLIVRLARQSGVVRLASPVDDRADDILADCASRLGIKRIPLLLQSDHAPTPMLVGVLRPIILLPNGLPDTCPEPELKAILLHELAHIKRRDMAVLWLYHIIQLAFFFNPALWLAGRQLKRERELACDELVLASDSITRRDYAAGYVSALKMAASSARAPISLAMAEPFEIEKRRLQMILRQEVQKFSLRWIFALAIIGAIGLPTFAGVASGEPQTAVELMKQVNEARARMQVFIKGGKGDVEYSRNVAQGPRHNVLKWSKSTISLAFRGERFAYSVGKTMGGIDPASAAYDGEWFRRRLKSGGVVVLRASAEDLHRGENLFADPAELAYPDIARVLEINHHDPAKARLISPYKRLGVMYNAIESKLDVTVKGGAKGADVWWFLLDPAKDNAVCQIRHWTEVGGAQTSDGLTLQTVYYKQLGDRWVPRSATNDVTLTDEKTGNLYGYIYETYRCSKNFAINVPVSDAELAVPAIPVQAPVLPRVTRRAASARRHSAATAASILPVQRKISAPFGNRLSPLTGKPVLHAGIDIAAPAGTPIKAVAAGTVVKSGWTGGYGKTVIVDQGKGVTELYAHCSRLDVKAGDRVKAGQVIAYVGNTGMTRGVNHLHFEKRINGKPLKPI